jgi:hypothetical protein
LVHDHSGPSLPSLSPALWALPQGWLFYYVHPFVQEFTSDAPAKIFFQKFSLRAACPQNLTDYTRKGNLLKPPKRRIEASRNKPSWDPEEKQISILHAPPISLRTGRKILERHLPPDHVIKGKEINILKEVINRLLKKSSSGNPFTVFWIAAFPGVTGSGSLSFSC